MGPVIEVFGSGVSGMPCAKLIYHDYSGQTVQIASLVLKLQG
jgi:hypothetical protein